MSEQESDLQTFVDKIPTDQLYPHGTSNLFVYLALNDPRMVEQRTHFPQEVYWRENHAFADQVLNWLEQNHSEIYKLSIKVAADYYDHDLEKSNKFYGHLNLLMSHVMWILLNETEFDKEKIKELIH